MSEKVINGVVYVWSILDNAWVPLDYWRWVNGNAPKPRPLKYDLRLASGDGVQPRQR